MIDKNELCTLFCEAVQMLNMAKIRGQDEIPQAVFNFIESLPGMSRPRLEFKKLTPEAKEPSCSPYSVISLFSAGEYSIPPGCTTKVSTKIVFGIPEGFEVHLRTPATLVSNSISILNSPGALKKDNEKEVIVILHNHHSFSPLKIKAGDKVAEAVLSKTEDIYFY